jgi:hypothetical protein
MATRPVIDSGRTSKKRIEAASNHIDHIRGDTDPKTRISVRAVTPMGRFHSEVPRQFGALETSLVARKSCERPSIRVGLARTDSGVKLLLNATPAKLVETQPAALRQSASFKTSVDNPLSPRAAALQVQIPVDGFGTPKLTRSNSGSSIDGPRLGLARQAAISASKSTIWSEPNDKDASKLRGVRTFHSALRTLQPNRVFDFETAQPLLNNGTPSRRSASPTFRSVVFDVLAAEPRQESAVRGIRTQIAAFEAPSRELRSFTPTRRYPVQMNTDTVFAPEPPRPSSEAPGRRRAFTPPPPPRGRCDLSLIDAPVVNTTHSGKKHVQADNRSEASSEVASRLSAGRRHFTPAQPPAGSGYLGRATSVQRSSERNKSTLSLAWN